MRIPSEPWLLSVAVPRPKLAKAAFEPAVARVYHRALRALHAKGVPILVGGAAALNHYTGIWRDTKDLDLFLRPRDVEDALATLEAEGFAPEVRDPVWLAKSHAPAEGLFLDLIHANSNGTYPVDDAWFDRAKATDLVGLDVKVVSAEDILLSKMFVGSRDRWDGADVLHLLYTQGNALDWDLVLGKGAPHWELLLSHLVLYRYVYPGEAHRVPEAVWREMLHRWTGTVQGPGPGAGAFRGRLLDPISFQVDVESWGLGDERQDHRGAAPRAGGRYA